MTNEQHPITPLPELVGQWLTETADLQLLTPSSLYYLATQAARWGWNQRGAATEAELQQRADQELEACCEWIRGWYGSGCGELINGLRAARRPKPPSLKEQALAALRQVGNCEEIDNATFDTIRRALETL